MREQDLTESSVEWEDSKRLDWLQSELAGSLELVACGDNPEDGVEWAIDGYCLGTDDLRKAIDGAREFVWVDPS